jgi:hypothetical protein
MAPEALRIETSSSRDAIDLIDAFHAHGFQAGLADTPGAWDVAVTGSVGAIVSVLSERLAAQGNAAAVVHATGGFYLVEAAAEPVPQRAVVAV